ncbi:ABC transporter permease [Nanoarchaeota archaeon]
MKLHRFNALMLKYYYITINRYDRIFDLVYWPLLDVVIWGLTSHYIEEISQVNLLSMLLGGVILWVFLWRSSQDIAVFVLEDFWSRNLYHLFSSPVKISEHVLSILILGFLRSSVSFLVLAVFASLLYHFNVFTLPLLFLAVGIGLLSLFGWAMGMFVTGMIFRFGKRIQVLAWSVAWIVQPFSCIFYTLDSLPAWAAAVAKINPLTYVFENLRSALYQGFVNYQQLFFAFIAIVVLLVFSTWFLFKSFERARITGLLAKSD